MAAGAIGLENMWRELVRLCNEQFESRPFTRLLNSKITKLRAQHYSIQMAYYVQNRRDCWGYVQGSAPCRSNKSSGAMRKTSWSAGRLRAKWITSPWRLKKAKCSA